MANYTVSNVTANKTLAVVFTNMKTISLGLAVTSDVSSMAGRWKVDNGNWTNVTIPRATGGSTGYIEFEIPEDFTHLYIELTGSMTGKTASWTSDWPEVGEQETYTGTSIIQNNRYDGPIDIAVLIKNQTFTITTTKTPANGGTISPENPTVQYDGSQTFQVTPASGYRIQSVTLDGTPIEPDS